MLVDQIAQRPGFAASRGADTPEVAVLGAGSAAALGVIDVVYVARRRISPAYLVDAAIEFSLVVGWLLAARTRA